ncbi:hypothetical protein [Brevundimonas sp.]|uniref:hypothetical protein n=1 Tax=Brevundimonas sp. TaxID=1871086 RepID=UPI002FC71C1B
MPTTAPSTPLNPVAFAAARLFRDYVAHCTAASPDTLFHTLTAMHSLNDRLGKASLQDFEQFEEFLALRALRNFAHHHDEVVANVRVIPSPAVSDLAFLCLVRRDQLERAIEITPSKWRAGIREACERKFHWYGDAININPCLFNFMVRAYEHLIANGVEVDGDAIDAFEASYQHETDHGLPHTIDGRLTGRAGDVEDILMSLVANLPPV